VDYAPGNDPYVISVGGVDDQGTKNTIDDAIASWSSSGTTQDGFAKPDVLAPGAHIVSNLAPNSAFASMCPSCIVDGQYIRAGGRPAWGRSSWSRSSGSRSSWSCACSKTSSGTIDPTRSSWSRSSWSTSWTK